MPYINVNTTIRLNDDQKEQLKASLGNVIQLIPGKTEGSLMVGICDSFDIFMGGIKKEKAAFVDVKIYGKASREAKEAVSAAIFKLFETLLGIGSNELYITFGEHQEWGYKGNLL